MDDKFHDLVAETVTSSTHLSKRHVHPRLLKMLEMGGMNAVFARGEGSYLYDTEGNRFLDFLAGGGVYFIGRNHEKVRGYLEAVLAQDLPNLSIVNASLLGGLLAERLIGLTGGQFNKVIYANSGTEATDVMMRFARHVTGRRRFLYLEGSFHGRSYAAISVCGFPELREGLDPALPTCTPIRPNDLDQLRRELRYGDVAGILVETCQGMTAQVMDPAWLREVERLCIQHGTLFLADEVQTGLGRTGTWFGSLGAGARPAMLSVSKTLSGGQVPVSAVLLSDSVYERVYQGFTSAPVYFSTFAENNLAMAAGLATLDVLEEIDAPAEAERKGEILRQGVENLAQRYDVIDRVQGKGLMMAIYFRDSAKPVLALQQKVAKMGDNSTFAAAVNLDLYHRHRVLVQIPGPHLNAIKILPPVVTEDDDLHWFLDALEDTLAECYGRRGPFATLAKKAAQSVLKSATKNVPPAFLPDALKTKAISATTDGDRRLFELSDYTREVVERCEVVVVGSGPGGALVAHELAAAGKDVILLEAGPRVRPEDMHQDMGKTLASWFWDGGTRATIGNVVMPTMQARVLGGGSVFNSAIDMRAHDSALDRWAELHGVQGLSGADLAPHYDAVEALFNVRPTQDAVQGRRNELFREGCEALGWRGEPTRRNEDGCEGSGHCIVGCKHGAKLSTDRRGVPEILANGGRVYTSVVVDEVIRRDGRVTGVSGAVVDTQGRRSHGVRILAKCVVLAAGACATPLILRRSGFTGEAVGGNLRMHPSSFHFGIFDEEVRPWTGATQGYHCTEFLETEGIKLEALWASPALLAVRFPGVGEQLKEQMASYDRVATWATWISGEDSVGTVRTAAGQPVHRYDVGPGDVRRLQEANARLAELFFAAGAKQVITGINGLPATLEPADGVDRIRRAKLTAKDFPTGSNHVFGTTAMGSDPERHVTDSWGRVHDVDDLYVCDTGLYPMTPGVNPQLTIMALGHRLGRELSARY